MTIHEHWPCMYAAYEVLLCHFARLSHFNDDIYKM